MAKKPSPKQLAELQDLYTALESDVGIGKVDEKLLQKFEQGELSKTDADKLRGELKDAMARRPSPAVPAKFRTELPQSSGQFLSSETDFQLKTPTSKNRALVLPKALTPEVVSGREPPRRALPPGQPGVIDAEFKTMPDYSIGKGQRIEMPDLSTPSVGPVGGALAIRTTESTTGEAALKNAVQVAEKNPVLKRLMLPVLAVAGVGAATYSALDKEGTPTQPPAPPTPPGPGPTPPAPAPTPGPTPPAAPSTAPGMPKIMKAKVVDIDKFQKPMDELVKRYAEDRQLTPEQRSAFDQRQQALQSALSDAKSIYDQATSSAKSEAERRDAITQWASIAESLGQAMVKYFAAREGARTGTLLGSKLQFQKYDWQKDLDRSLERLKADTAEAKTSLGIAREDVEAQAKQLGEERKATTAEREDIAQQKFKSSSGLLTEQMRAQQRAEEDVASAYNRFLLEQAQEEKAAAREAAREQKATTKQETKTTEEIANATKKALDAFSTGFSTSKDRRASYRGDMEKELFTLNATEAEVKRLNELIDHTYGQRDETDKAEARALINSISQRKLGGASAAPAATGMVDMIAPDGRELSVPASRVAEMEAKGARRK